MFASAGILVVVVGILILELPKLLKNRWKKELWVFLVLLSIGTGLSMAESFQVKLPNPLDWITIVYKPLNDVMTGVLK